MLELVFENQTPDTQWNEAFFSRIAQHTLTRLNLDAQKNELGIHLILPERSRELNAQYRGKDTSTDVLSFPINDTTLKKYDILPLGDIFICLEVAEKQAAELHVPIQEELARLAVHGLLHLLGHDHEQSSDAATRMIELQESIIASLP